jgi:hypothetical protein
MPSKVKSITPRPSAPPPDLERAAASPYAEMSDGKLRRKLRLYTEEWAMLSADSSQAALTRRVELARLQRQIADVLSLREPIVEVHVPASVTGEPFIIGPASFNPGFHRVPKSVAEYLLWMISENQRIELQRTQSKNRNLNLGHIGERARMARIARDDGRDDDYSSRGG